MPLDIRSQVVTALDNINRNPELYTPPKLTTPLETRINDLKETNPNKYREYISTLTSSANSGNEEARELLGKIGEDAARRRRGYEGLNKAMYIPAVIGAGALAAPSISAAGKGASWLYSQLPKWIRTGVDVGLTADGVRNSISNNGVQKTYREAKAGNYRKAILSGIGDMLDIGGGINLVRRSINTAKAINNARNMSLIHRTNYIDFNDGPNLPTTSSIPNTTHFTTGVSVRPHSWGDWTDNTTTVILPFKDAEKANIYPSSIEPMDTFFLSLDGKFKLPRTAKVITTDSNIYENSLKNGLQAKLISINNSKNPALEWDNIISKEAVLPTKNGYKWLERIQRLRGNKIKTHINPQIIDDTSNIAELQELTKNSSNIYYDPNFVLKSRNNLFKLSPDIQFRIDPNVHERHWSSSPTLSHGFEKFSSLPKFEQKALYPKLEERAKEATNILLDRLTSNRSKENLFGGMQPNLDIIEIFNKAAK